MIYLDNAATSFPKPPAVLAAVSRCIADECGNPGRGGHRMAMRAAELVYECRGALADFFGGVAPEQFIFTLNATMAINMALYTRVRPGDHILISDMEHNAVRRPVERLTRAGLVSSAVFPHNGPFPDVLEQCIADKKSGILIVTARSNVNGAALPVQQIVSFCRSRGYYTIVDGSQQVGHEDVSLTRLNPDAYCGPGHKGLLGPAGCGFLWLRSGEGLREFLSGGSGFDSRSPHMPGQLPERFEAGTLPTPAIAGLREGIRFLEGLGCRAVEEQERELLKQTLELLGNIGHLTLYASEYFPLSFSSTKMKAEDLATHLDRAGILVRAGLHCAPLAHQTLGTQRDGLVRISPSVFTRSADLHALAATLSRLS